MNIKELFLSLSAFERGLYLCSIFVIVLSFLIFGGFDILIAAALVVGATSLIFCAKGLPIGQVLMVIFSLIYGYISLKFRYYGEMITYLGMTMPIAIASTVAWLKHPFEKGKSEVKVDRLSKSCRALLLPLTVIVTAIFYYILALLDTPNLLFSTLSIATSFSASYLTFFRSPYYALAYAANDIILIVLWVYASFSDSSYIAMVICFLIFLANDAYGFVNWIRMKKLQESKKTSEK